MDTEMQQAPAVPACPADMDQLSYGQVKNQAIAQAAPGVKQPPEPFIGQAALPIQHREYRPASDMSQGQDRGVRTDLRFFA